MRPACVADLAEDYRQMIYAPIRVGGGEAPRLSNLIWRGVRRVYLMEQEAPGEKCLLVEMARIFAGHQPLKVG
jgi:hypothetical protein